MVLIDYSGQLCNRFYPPGVIFWRREWSESSSTKSARELNNGFAAHIKISDAAAGKESEKKRRIGTKTITNPLDDPPRVAPCACVGV